MAFSDLAAIMPSFAALRRSLRLSAFEFFDRRSVEQVSAHANLVFPLDPASPYFAVVEFDNPKGESEDDALAVFEQLLEDGQVGDGVLSQSASQAAELWRWREFISEAITPRTPYKNDLSVRVSRVPAFLGALDALVGRHYPDFEVVWFGHIGDGNLHMNILRPPGLDVDAFRAACDALSPRVFELVQAHGGSISAEHGVGLLKRDYLHYSRNPAEIEALRGLKAVFDPDCVLNPGKLLT
jgi:FAD/FMN-containing dehydrogenase